MTSTGLASNVSRRDSLGRVLLQPQPRKLIASDVHEIRTALLLGRGRRELALLFWVRPGHIQEIELGKIWVSR